MVYRIAINGFGRIGRDVFRILNKRRKEFEIVAINGLAPADVHAHLLRYDTICGRYDADIAVDRDGIVVDGHRTIIVRDRDPIELPWEDLEIDCVVESSGAFRTRSSIQKHIDAGAKRVVLTVPAKDKVDAMIVRGVNDEDLRPEHEIVSAASCTTTCLAPVAKVLHDSFGIRRGMVTTIHAYTNDQNILDLRHKDLRRARAAAQNIIPTTTGAARAVGKVMPALKGKLDGMAVRVPVPDGSLVDLVVELERDAGKKEVNAAMEEAAGDHMEGIIEYCTDPIVSSDVINNPYSSIYDSLATMAIDRNLVKVLAWYDNEWGYSQRVCDLVERVCKFLPEEGR